MPSYTLQPITESSDFPALAQISNTAFLTDRHTQLKAANPRNPYDHYQGTRDALPSSLERSLDGTVDMMKAVDTQTGEIAGWVCWGQRGLVSSTKQTLSNIEEKRQEESKTEDPAEAAPKDPLKPLGDLTSTDLREWMERLMPPGTRCRFIVGISIHPSHQGKGIGTQLIKHGIDRADREGVFCWVHSSAAAWPTFEKSGFREVGRLEVDLDHWAAEVEKVTGQKLEPPDDEPWGKYVFRYMKREPMKTTDIKT